MSVCEPKPWQFKIDYIEEILNKWSVRDLSLFGRIQVIKSFAPPQIILAGTVLPIPPGVVNVSNQIFYRFVWGSTDKVKRSKVAL